MLVRAHGFAIRRGIAEHLLVELDVRLGLPSFAVVGLGGAAGRDTRERVHAAILNIGLSFPRKRVTVNIAPASQRRLGAELDLAIACCVLAAEGHLDAVRLARLGLFAELGLGGALRPCAGVAAAAAAADDAGLRGLIVARDDLREARAAATLPIAGRRGLGEVVELLGARVAPTRSEPGAAAPRSAASRGAGPAPATPRPLRAVAAATALRGPHASSPGSATDGSKRSASADAPAGGPGPHPSTAEPSERGGGPRRGPGEGRRAGWADG